MKNTINKLVIIAILFSQSVKANSQITVKIDSLSYSNIELISYSDGFEGPPIQIYFTLENHSGQDILAFTMGDCSKGKPNVCLELQMLFEYDGKKFKSSFQDLTSLYPQNLTSKPHTIEISEIGYNYKGNIGDALIMHNGESFDGWDCIFFPFEDMVQKYKDPDNRSAEYTRLKKLVPEILPTITIEAHRVERVWNGEHFDTYELDEQCCCPAHCQCSERK